jgi:hypothetical protein
MVCDGGGWHINQHRRMSPQPVTWVPRGDSDAPPTKGSLMKRLTRTIMATGAIMAAVVLAAATPNAVADTSTLRLGCLVDSSALDKLTPDHCVARFPARQYTVYYEVLGYSPGYTYNWHTNGSTVSFGCTPSSAACALDQRAAGHDWSLTTSVDVTELATGSTKTVTATAEGAAVCWFVHGFVWC